MHGTLAHAAFAAQICRPAETFALMGEVPHPAVASTVDVADHAADVAVLGHARIGGVVEELLAEVDLRGQDFPAYGLDEGHGFDGIPPHSRDVGDSDFPGKEIVDEEQAIAAIKYAADGRQLPAFAPRQRFRGIVRRHHGGKIPEHVGQEDGRFVGTWFPEPVRNVRRERW